MRKWRLAPAHGLSQADFPYDNISLQLLHNRGIDSLDAIESFFNPEKYNFDPFLFRDMASAIDMVIRHIKGGSKMIVYGDYDVDGVTSSVILAEALTTLKADASIYIPDRVKEGYGLNREAIKSIADSGAALIITVDNGIRNKPEVDFVKKCGLDIIITDHHVLPESRQDLPDCLVIDPADKDDKYPWRTLCGAGVALKFVQALVSRSTLSADSKEAIIRHSLDLAAIGTIGDLVPLLGENRRIAKEGLKIINSKPRLGLKALIAEAKTGGDKELEAWNLSWQIVPRINAASRMDHANTAVSLMMSTNLEESKTLAADLNAKNQKRQSMTENIFCQAEEAIKDKEAKILIAISPDGCLWSEGLIGLAAGKLSEKYYRPVIVIANVGGNNYKASGRSIAEFNMIEAINSAAGFLTKYGGHPMACGFSLQGRDNLSGFCDLISKIAEDTLAGHDLLPTLAIDAEIELADINLDLMRLITQFSPFGQDNPQPVFSSRGLEIKEIMFMGSEGKHIKWRVNQAGGKPFSILMFSAPDNMRGFSIGDIIDVAYILDINQFNGRQEIQLKAIDIKKI